MVSEFEVVIRLLLSAFVSGIIGYEREVHSRPAGLRTHMLVTLGSTLIMLISIDGFSSGDPSRLAAQVVSGIGFLGAGTIMRTGNNISGLTTAASLWVCAGIGLAIGAGYYLGAIVTTLIVLFALLSSGWIEKRSLKSKYKSIEIIAVNKPGIIGEIEGLLDAHHVVIKDISLENNNGDSDDYNGLMKIKFLVKYSKTSGVYELFKEIYKIEGIVSISS